MSAPCASGPCIAELYGGPPATRLGFQQRAVHRPTRQFLDVKGAIAPRRGPANAMADFHAGVIAYATEYEDTGVVAANCFKCKKVEVRIARAQDDAIVWSCPRCNAEGRISNWQGTLWDLSDRPDASN